MTAVYELPKTVRAEVVARKGEAPYTIIEVPSSSGSTTYRVDVTNQRCSCPAWKFKSERKMCKHLKAFGFTDLVCKAPTRTQTDFEVEL